MNRPAVCALALLLLVACNPQPQPGHSPAPSPSATGLPPLTITGHAAGGEPIRATLQSNGRKVYALQAQSYQSHSAQNVAQATFEHAVVTFYDASGTTLTAQAPHARLDDARKQVILFGGVHATTSTGMTLTCSQLVYDQQSALLHGSGNVRITGMQGGQQQILTGSTFTSDVKLTRMTMK